MDIEKIKNLIDTLAVSRSDLQFRLAVDYDPQVVKFLRERGYGFFVQDDAFGVQIVVSDANYIVDPNIDSK